MTFKHMPFAYRRRQPSETALLFQPSGRAGSPAKMHSEQIHDVKERTASPRQSFRLFALMRIRTIADVHDLFKW
jgi:hypothetical protein